MKALYIFILSHLHIYFKSKEDLFKEIFAVCNNDKEINELKYYAHVEHKNTLINGIGKSEIHFS